MHASTEEEAPKSQHTTQYTPQYTPVKCNGKWNNKLYTPLQEHGVNMFSMQLHLHLSIWGPLSSIDVGGLVEENNFWQEVTVFVGEHSCFIFLPCFCFYLFISISPFLLGQV